MTTASLPQDIWFLPYKGRLWPIRPEGRAATFKYVVATVVCGLGGLLIAALGSQLLGITLGAGGIAALAWWFTRFTRRHADFSIDYEEYMRARVETVVIKAAPITEGE